MLDSSVVTLGSFDIGERYQGYLEERLYGEIFAISLTEGSGQRILDEVVKVACSDWGFGGSICSH